MATHSTLLGYFLWLPLGLVGVHRFYFGRSGTGALFALLAVLAGVGWYLHLEPYYLAPAGLLAAAWLVDLFLIPRIRRDMARRYQVGRYSYTTAWLLLLSLGVLGAHRFYVGRWRTGILYLLTLGVLGLGVLYDIVIFNNVVSEDNERWISGAPRLSRF